MFHEWVNSIWAHSTGQNDRALDAGDIISVASTIYGEMAREHPKVVVNVPLAIDLLLNWILNVYDSARSGKVRALSFKVAIVLMCKVTYLNWLVNLAFRMHGKHRIGSCVSMR